MYRFINQKGAILSTLSSPTWITVYDNGCYGICEKDDAHGVLIDGIVYHIEGLPEINNVETIYIVEITEYQYQQEQTERQMQLEDAIAELSILISQMK